MADDIYYFGELHTVADPGRGPGAQASPLFLDQTKARKGENIFFWDRPQPLSESLDPLLACTKT